MDRVGRAVCFRGRVQGVGFRATVHEVCARQGVGGWVRNEADGDVRAELHGNSDAVEFALAEVRRRRDRYLRDCRIEVIPFDESCANRGFEVRW